MKYLSKQKESKLMSFEEKYNSYRKRKLNVSDDYVNKMSNKVSEKISERKGLKIPIGWSLSGVSFAAAVLLIALFVYPKFIGNETNPSVVKNPTDSINNMAQVDDELPKNGVENMPNTLQKNDSGSFAVENKKQQEVNFETADLDKETIIEYLLDEGYEEI